MKFKLTNLNLRTLAPILLFGAVFTVNTAVNAQADVEQTSDNAKADKANMHFEDRKERMHKRKGERMEKRADKHMAQIDTNQDGNVDLSEYLSNAEQRFNEMDVDGDNIVTGEEAREHHKSMRKKHADERKNHKMERKQKHKEMHEQYKAEIDKAEAEE